MCIINLFDFYNILNINRISVIIQLLKQIWVVQQNFLLKS